MNLEELNERIKRLGVKRSELADALKVNYYGLSCLLNGSRPLKESMAAHIELLLEKLERENGLEMEARKPKHVTFSLTVDLPSMCCDLIESSMEGLSDCEREEVLAAMARKALARLRELGADSVRGIGLT